MGLIALIAATLGVVLTVVNITKTANDWTTTRKAARIEKKQGEMDSQIAAWRGIVDDLSEQVDRNDRRLSSAEDRLAKCEEERDEMYRKYILKEEGEG